MRPQSAPGRTAVHSFLGLALMFALGLPAPAVSGTVATAAPEECSTGSLSSARVAHGSAQGRDYNTVSPAEAQAMDGRLQLQVDRLVASGQLTKGGALKGNRFFAVRTHIHIITRSDGTGGVTRQQVRDQIAVINAGYAGKTSRDAAASPFRFVVASVDVTANDAWYDWHLTEDFSDEDAEAKAAKRALHRGGWADLNVYIAGLGDGLLGYATFPQDGPRALDGLVLLNESLPGGAAAPYNEGDTATHEIGHWLGLFHTFENGCQAPGDHVADTPAQFDGDNIFFCNESDDTCPQKGLDPVHNFMSYGDDPCLDRFTAGQNGRQIWNWLGLRANR